MSIIAYVSTPDENSFKSMRVQESDIQTVEPPRLICLALSVIKPALEK